MKNLHTRAVKMGAVLAVLVIGALAITAIVLGSIAVHRSHTAVRTSNSALANNSVGGGGGGGDVTLTGAQTLTNKTLTAPIVSRMTAGGAAPTVTSSGPGSSNIATPSMGTGSSDMAGFILCDGTNTAPLGAFQVNVTFSAAYSTAPTAVIVNGIQADSVQFGLPVLTWNTTGFVISYPGGAQGAIPVSGVAPYWSYIVL